MTVKSDFNRKKELIWFPVLHAAGFRNLQLSGTHLDIEEATDIEGVKGQHRYRFTVRSRNASRYTTQQLAGFKREFTIRYSRPSGVPTEWEKLFSDDFPNKPDYFVYGWTDNENHDLLDYVILDVVELRRLHDSGRLSEWENTRKTNVDIRRSEFVPIPIQRLNEKADGRLVYWHSPDHPAFGPQG